MIKERLVGFSIVIDFCVSNNTMKWVTDGEKCIWNTNSNQRVNVFSTQKDSTIEKWVKEVSSPFPVEAIRWPVKVWKNI